MTPGHLVKKREWQGMWDDLLELMKYGVETGRIDTVAEDHTPEAMGRDPRQDDHGGEVYVYRRQGQHCLRLRLGDPDRDPGRTQPLLVPQVPAHRTDPQARTSEVSNWQSDQVVTI